MHIFLVNDDGIGAKGIMALLRAAVRRGHEVTMCAPKYQQSAASQRFTLVDPLYASEYPVEEPGCKAWAITGSPADCVRVGMNQLIEKPVDIVISGINDGYNAGVAVHYSGTVGAAMEGRFHHLPSIAASIHHKATQEMIDHLADFTIRTAEQYVTKTVPDGMILNINAPLAAPGEIRGSVYAPLDQAYYTDHYERRQSPRAGDYFWLEAGSPMESFHPGSDNDYLEKGYITMTLMGHPSMMDKAFWESLDIR